MITLDHATAFAERWSAIEPGLRRALAGRLAHAADRDDALQEAALIAWRLRDRYDASRPFGPWAWGIARHCLRRVRQPAPSRVEGRVVATGDEPPAGVERLEIALGRLAADERELLLAAHGEGTSLAAIAARSGQSPRQVSARLRRAERRLRRLLASL